MSSERLDIHNCRWEEFLKAVINFETRLNHRALRSPGGQVIFLYPFIQLAEMRIPFSTTHVQGFNEMRQILTNLKVEDLCLTRHGWENRGISINRSDNGRTTKQSQYVNMQGLSIDVDDIRLTRIGQALNVFPPEQIMHANQILWEGLDRYFTFATPQSNPNYRDFMGSALTTFQYIKILLQRCLEWNQSRIYVQLDDLLVSDLSDWENYCYFKKDLGLFVSAVERASGVAYGEADQVIANKLITLQAAAIKRDEAIYPHGLVQTILDATRLILMGEPLQLSAVLARTEYIYQKGPHMKSGQYNYPITLRDLNEDILTEAQRVALAEEYRRNQFATNFAYRADNDEMNRCPYEKQYRLYRQYNSGLNRNLQFAAIARSHQEYSPGWEYSPDSETQPQADQDVVNSDQDSAEESEEESETSTESHGGSELSDARTETVVPRSIDAVVNVRHASVFSPSAPSTTSIRHKGVFSSSTQGSTSKKISASPIKKQRRKYDPTTLAHMSRRDVGDM